MLAGCGVLLVLTGCGSDEPSTPAEPTAATSGSSSVSEAPTGMPSGSPTGSPTAPAAAGPVLTMDVAEVNAPTGWTREEQLVPLEDGARGPEGRMSLTETPAFGSTLAEIAAVRLKGDRASLRRLPDIEVAGQPVVHITDRGPRGDYRLTTEEGFTAVYLDRAVTVLLQLDRDVPETERQQLVAEVLASVVWK